MILRRYTLPAWSLGSCKRQRHTHAQRVLRVFTRPSPPLYLAASNLRLDAWLEKPCRSLTVRPGVHNGESQSTLLPLVYKQSLKSNASDGDQSAVSKCQAQTGTSPSAWNNILRHNCRPRRVTW